MSHTATKTKRNKKINNLVYNPLQTVSIEAKEDLPKNRFISYDGKICRFGGTALGVTEVDWNEGDRASVITDGIAIVESSDNFLPGHKVTSDPFGKASNWENDMLTHSYGRALNECKAGEYLRVLLNH